MAVPGGDIIKGNFKIDDSYYLLSSWFCGRNVSPFVHSIPEIIYAFRFLLRWNICFVETKEDIFQLGYTELGYTGWDRGDK